MSKPAEPTRPVSAKAGAGGTWHATSILTPEACNTRVRIDVPPSKVMPIIFVPGIMGSNLKATKGNMALREGEPAWRPPNGTNEGGEEVKRWKDRAPAVRQKILNGPTVAVDSGGATNLYPLHDTIGLSADEARENGWGEVHSDSYQNVLYALRRQFSSFVRPQLTGGDTVTATWGQLNLFVRNAEWREKSGPLCEISDCDVRKLAAFHYPVYAVGYNWLESNAVSAILLQQRIEAIIKKWRDAGRQCDKVILVTHSMGGLVARACAKKITDKIAGVVHGCMPAFGAPACYRRVACGTEQSSPSKGAAGNYVMKQVAIILGDSPAKTVPVIGNSVGALELLPTHRYPAPWLFASVSAKLEQPRVVALPMKNPYDLYANTKVWYRLVDLALMNPGAMLTLSASEALENNVRLAEQFHRTVLDDFYHPNTYAFYGVDSAQLAYGSFTWTAASGSNFHPTNQPQLPLGEWVSSNSDGRMVRLTSDQQLLFSPSAQDASGDGTVPIQSGEGPDGIVRKTVKSAGYDHQGGYNNQSMVYLTLLLVSRIALQNV